MGISLAFVPLVPKAKINSKAIAADIAAKWPDSPPATPVKAEKPGQFVLELGDCSIIGQLVAKPIPQGSLEESIDTSMLWPAAREDLRPHAGHIIVTVLDPDEDVRLRGAKILTYAVAGILGSCPEALGVAWGPRALLCPSQLFQEMAAKLLPDGLPLYLWVQFRAGKSPDGTTSGFTIGMSELGHKEFETANASDSVPELRERLFNLALYVLESGPVILDGNTIGADANEKIQVVYGESQFGNEGEVMRLDYRRVGKPKRR